MHEAVATPIDDAVRQAFAPTGRLRVTINHGNAVLARCDDVGAVSGVSVDLAHALAERLSLPCDLLPFAAAGKAVAAVEAGEADVGFFARDPQRAREIAFTAAEVLIEGSFLVRDGSIFRCNEDIDQPGVRVTVGLGSAYDLYLTRTLRHATIERAATSPTVVRVFRESGSDVAAGVRQQLEASSLGLTDLRLLPDRFMVIEQAMGIHRSRGPLAARVLAEFIEDVKADGRVAAALARHGITDVSVAPAMPPGSADIIPD